MPRDILGDTYEILPNPNLIKPLDLLPSLQKGQGIEKQLNNTRRAQSDKSRRWDLLGDPQVLSPQEIEKMDRDLVVLKRLL